MATKLRAYYKEGSKWNIITRWDILDLSDIEYNNFLKNYKLHINPTDESEELTFNRLQKTFRYLPSETKRIRSTKDSGMTLSHLVAQEVIADLDIINFTLKDRRNRENKNYNITLRRSNSVVEHLIVRDDQRIVTDVKIWFNEPYDLAYKWGGALNIEIMVTSKATPEKIVFCEKEKEALIEVKLSSKLLQDIKISEATKDDEDRMRRYMHNAFSNRIFADILVSPSSNAYLSDKTIKELNLKIKALEKDNKTLKSQLTKIKSESDIEVIKNKIANFFSSK